MHIHKTGDDLFEQDSAANWWTSINPEIVDARLAMVPDPGGKSFVAQAFLKTIEAKV